MTTRTQVTIIGAGPAGLLLGHLLQAEGVDTVILESRTRAYVERRQRAGILEHGTVEVLRASGAGTRMDAEGIRHDGIELRFDGEAHRIDFPSLTGGRSVMVYAQTEVVKDLIALRQAPILFEAEALDIADATTSAPAVRYRHEGTEHTLVSDVVVACDGFHGIGRTALPSPRRYEKTHPYSWLGILADVPPSCEELIYAHHERGFALHSMRSHAVSRLYLQVPNGTDLADWPDDRIWTELATRLGVDGWELGTGPITDRSVTPMRSFVAEPLRHGRLFLAGDAAHIVPPTGAKGLNLAVADVTRLADALTRWYRKGEESPLDSYSADALARIWRAEAFSHEMTTMLHTDPDADPFDRRIQLERLRRTAAAPAVLADGYVGASILRSHQS